jgi:cysteine desulfuration protein SufE
MNKLKSEIFTPNDFGGDINIDRIVETFGLFDDWEDRYAYIIDLGKKLPPFPDEARLAENKIHGCQSQVWLTHYYDKAQDKLYFLIDSDALIVKGLAAVVLAMLNAKQPKKMLAVDVQGIFQSIDLISHISPTRGNGLEAMVAKFRGIAQSVS